MRNKWPAYAVSLLLTATVVASSMFLPQILLQQQEARMLGVENNQGISRYQSRLFPRASNAPTPSAWAEPTGMPTAQPSDASLEEFVAKIRLLENSEEGETYKREPTEGEMTMKQAVTSSIDQIEEYMQAGAMLALPNFPEGYSVYAALSTIRGKSGTVLNYWSISLATKSDPANQNGGISLLLDAETGAILSYKMSTNAQKQLDLPAGLSFIASRLGLGGAILKYTPPKESQNGNAIWVCGNRAFYITLFGSTSGDNSAMSMSMTTKLPVP